ncbi:MAG: MFS transporter [Solirubrobacterales bacterium]
MSAQDRHGSAGVQLALATTAFTVSFYAWSLLGPLSPDLQEHLGLSDFQTSAMVAIPVLLGSIMRIPLGWLTDRYGGRHVFSLLLVYTPVPLIALAAWHDSLGTMLMFGFLLGFAGASFAVGVPFVSGWYLPERRGFALGVYGTGMGGTVLAGLTAPRIADHWGLAAPFWVSAGLVGAMAIVFWAGARDAPTDADKGARPGMFASLSVFRGNRRAWALTSSTSWPSAASWRCSSTSRSC